MTFVFWIFLKVQKCYRVRGNTCAFMSKEEENEVEAEERTK